MNPSCPEFLLVWILIHSIGVATQHKAQSFPRGSNVWNELALCTSRRWSPRYTSPGLPMLPGSTVALKKAVRSQWFLDVFGFPVLLQTAWARASTSDVPNVQVSTVIIGTTCWVGSNSSQIWQPVSGSSTWRDHRYRKQWWSSDPYPSKNINCLGGKTADFVLPFRQFSVLNTS